MLREQDHRRPAGRPRRRRQADALRHRRAAVRAERRVRGLIVPQLLLHGSRDLRHVVDRLEVVRSKTRRLQLLLKERDRLVEDPVDQCAQPLVLERAQLIARQRLDVGTEELGHAGQDTTAR